MRQTPAAYLEQMLRRDSADRHVVCSYKMGRDPLESPIDEDDRRVLFLDPPKNVSMFMRRSNHQDIHAPHQQLLDFLFLQFRIAFGRREHHAVAFSAKGSGE